MLVRWVDADGVQAEAASAGPSTGNMAVARTILS